MWKTARLAPDVEAEYAACTPGSAGHSGNCPRAAEFAEIQTIHQDVEESVSLDLVGDAGKQKAGFAPKLAVDERHTISLSSSRGLVFFSGGRPYLAGRVSVHHSDTEADDQVGPRRLPKESRDEPRAHDRHIREDVVARG